MKQRNIDATVSELLQIKKLSRLDRTFLKTMINRFLKQDPPLEKLYNIKEHTTFKKNKTYKIFLKTIKRFLHHTYGIYQLKNNQKKDRILERMQTCKNKKELLQLHNELLHCHTSSRERKKDYPKLYKKLFSLYPKTKSILDIGCGLNPISIPYITKKNIHYYAYDVAKKDQQLLEKYFRSIAPRYDVTGTSDIINIFTLTQTQLAQLPKADLCFLFKMTDVLDYFQNNRKNTAGILQKLPVKHVVVSFSTKTVSNKPMNHPRRIWFERLLDSLHYSYTPLFLENELFYCISKTN